MKIKDRRGRGLAITLNDAEGVVARLDPAELKAALRVRTSPCRGQLLSYLEVKAQ